MLDYRDLLDRLAKGTPTIMPASRREVIYEAADAITALSSDLIKARELLAEAGRVIGPVEELGDQIMRRNHVLGEYITVAWTPVTWNGSHAISPATLCEAKKLRAKIEEFLKP